MLNWYRAVERRRRRIVIDKGGRVDAPVLIIWGEAHSALGLKMLEGVDRYVESLAFHPLSGVSHWVQREAPGAVNFILAAWLRKRSL